MAQNLPYLLGMPFLSPHRRTLCKLIAALACVAALLSEQQAAMAGFSLSGDEAVAHEIGQSGGRLAMATDDANNLAVYLPAASGSQGIDLSITSTAGAAPTTSAPVPTETSPEPTPADHAGVSWLAALSSNSASQAAGTSAPAGSMAAGSPAALDTAHQSVTDLQVTGWLQDASRLSLPKSMPRTLLRPPQA